MSTPITVPPMGESVTEATVARWLKKVGDAVRMDEPLVELETDKVTLEVNATTAGTLTEINVPQGGRVAVGAVLGTLGAVGSVAAPPPSAVAAPPPPPPPAASPPPVPLPPAMSAPAPAAPPSGMGPAARKLAEEKGVNPYGIPGTGRNGRVTKDDVARAEMPGSAVAAPCCAPSAPSAVGVTPAPAPAPAPAPSRAPGARPRADREERVRLTRLRQRIAERLKEAQNTAAMLTTFNEVDMSAIMATRNAHKDAFEKKHGVKLGFMSFFVKAVVQALKEIPAVNAEIEGDDIIYKNYYDIGVAVGTPQGLVVPVLRDSDQLDFAGIEKGIADLGRRARDGKLTMAELSGGTFTITNGGIYGSLMSTPILNPPQSGILGMHAIKDRPVVVNGAIVARPMMYVALSYDHRIIDGREAVTFLVRVKECLENPERLLLGA